jgi:hypothetical protein
MKLVIVTAVAEFEQDILPLFKKANISSFSGSHIDGFKNTASLLRSASWFPTERGGVESILLFSFAEEDNIEVLFGLLAEFNNHLETQNPVKAVVVPIERSL